MNHKKFTDRLILRFSVVLMAISICGFAFIACDTAMEMAEDVMQPTQPETTPPTTTTPPSSTTSTEESTTEDEEELTDLPGTTTEEGTTGDEEELTDLPGTTTEEEMTTEEETTENEEDNQGSSNPPGFENDPNVDPQGLERYPKVACSIGSSQVVQFWFCFFTSCFSGKFVRYIIYPHFPCI